MPPSPPVRNRRTNLPEDESCWSFIPPVESLLLLYSSLKYFTIFSLLFLMVSLFMMHVEHAFLVVYYGRSRKRVSLLLCFKCLFPCLLFLETSLSIKCGWAIQYLARNYFCLKIQGISKVILFTLTWIFLLMGDSLTKNLNYPNCRYSRYSTLLFT